MKPLKHLPEMNIDSVHHFNQRYDTLGDYFRDRWGDDKSLYWKFRVSRMSDPRYELLVLIHEEVEWFLTQQAGIPEREIKRFDTDHPELIDPGADIRACYYKQHRVATKIEKYIAKQIGVNWKEYCKECDSMTWEKK